MAGETVITVVGNLVNDPEMRYTNSGAAVATFRIASTPRTLDRQTGDWKDGEALFLTCSVWREAAENAVQSLQRGARVIVQGRLRQRTYDTKEGEKRTVVELEVDEVGPSLRYATATVQKATRSSGGGGGGGGGFGSGGGGGNRQFGGNSGGSNNTSGGGGGRGNSNDFNDDPWATAAPAGNSGNSRSGGGNSSFDDEPPF